MSCAHFLQTDLEGMHVLFDVKRTSPFLCCSISEEYLFYVKVVL